MSYDYEKYRVKREKVLGVRKRGLSFGTITTIVSLCIIVGLGSLIIPKSIAFLSSRNLDDAIYKTMDGEDWPQGVVQELSGFHGIKNVVVDEDGKRIVVTFDRSMQDTKKIALFFKTKGVSTMLLNTLSHSNRQAVLEKESKF